MKFVQLSDTHIMNDYGDLFMGFMKSLKSPREKLERILKEIDWKDISFIVFTGDLIHDGGSEDYTLLKKTISQNIPAEIEKIYVLGNHDNKEDFYKIFLEMAEYKQDNGLLYYTREIEEYRLIVLDSAYPGLHRGKIGNNQLDWLKNLLGENSEKSSLIFMHHPLNLETEGDNSTCISNSKDVLEIIKDKNVAGIFSGHSHTNEISFGHGIFQTTADSTAFTVDRKKPGYIRIMDRVGYSLVEVNDSLIKVHYEQVEEEKITDEVKISDYQGYMKNKYKEY